MNNHRSSSRGPVSFSGDGDAIGDVESDGESDDQQRWRDIEQVWEDVSPDSESTQQSSQRAERVQGDDSGSQGVATPKDKSPDSESTQQSSQRAERAQGDDSGSQGVATPKGNVQKPDFSIAVQRARGSDQSPPLQGSERGPVDEQVRKLRTELLLRHGHRNTATLGFAIVSTSPGEGRSLMAAELAKSFARLGRSTLLVDADMRRPSQHRIFGVDLGRGLIQSIVEGPPPELNGIDSLSGLSLLTAGSDLGFDPSELLSNTRFKTLMDSLQNIFEFIIVDTPPFNLYPDAQVISAVVGRAMTLHRSASSNYKDTRSMLRSLAISHVEVIGGVLNRV